MNFLHRLTVPGYAGHAVALLAGALLPGAFAPFDLWPLALLCPALLLTLLQELPAGDAARRAWCFGFGLFGSGTSWVYVSIHDYGAAPVPLAAFLTATFCAGLALFPADGDTSDLLMKNADTAMYHAKSEGRNNTQFFTISMENAARERMGLERDLRLAIEQEQLAIHYQPQIDGRTGRAVGVEALLRWWHPQHGQISPAKFIPIAEESGLILALGDWTIREACRQLRQWQDQGLGRIGMSVNLSIMQLGSPTLLDHVRRTLEEFQIENGDLELEVSESGVMKNTEEGIGKLQSLREMGVKLSIDDFGTGYSSLSYLQRLPIYALKLDQSFVRDMEWEASNATICASTLSLAHGLGLQVVAEGVETEAQRRMLVKNGCDVLQGYLFSRPLPADEALRFLLMHAQPVRDGVSE